jgi:hypothetical protein
MDDNYTMNDWINALQVYQSTNQSVETANNSARLENVALNSASEAGFDQNRINVLGEDKSRADAKKILVDEASKGAEKKFKSHSNRDNLEKILGNLKKDQLKELINNYNPDVDENSDYADAANLHSLYKTIGDLNEYAKSGDVNRNNDKALDSIAIGLIQEMMSENPDKYIQLSENMEKEEKANYIQAAMLLAYSSREVRVEDFKKLAPDAEKAKKKAFYKSISNKGEPTNENLKNYIMATVKDENIEKVLGNYLPKYIESNRN